MGSLAEAATEVAVGRAGPQELHEVFLAATVFVERGEAPGFMASGPPGAGLVPCSAPNGSSFGLAVRCGGSPPPGSTCSSLLPDGYDIVLDMAGDAPLRLPPAALRPATATEVGRE